jgi:hypothetical protein
LSKGLKDQSTKIQDQSQNPPLRTPLPRIDPKINTIDHTYNIANKIALVVSTHLLGGLIFLRGAKILAGAKLGRGMDW